MARITRVYTRTGDDGTTGLGGGQRVAKDSLRIAAYGTVDELNSVLGTVLLHDVGEDVAATLSRVQHELFRLGSSLCVLEDDKERMPVPEVEAAHVAALERDIDALQEGLEPLRNFILPGGSPGSAHLHVARTVCRRAERLTVSLAREEAVHAAAVEYLNRLSDWLFVAARAANSAAGVADVLWDAGGDAPS